MTRIVPLAVLLLACGGQIDPTAEPFAGGDGQPTGKQGGTLDLRQIWLDGGVPVSLTPHPDAGKPSDASVPDVGPPDASKPPAADASVPDASVAPPPVSNNGITYHGGPIMSSPQKVYFIWYGNWQTSLARTILVDWAAGIGGSAYYAINTTYTDGSGNHVPNAVSFGGQSFDPYSQGTSLNDTLVAQAVTLALQANQLPKDANGVYFVLASKDVSEPSGFCNKYCGWHAGMTNGGTWIKYGFVGDGDRCPGACEAQPLVSPNGSPSADGMASVLAHELEEAATDPIGTGWFDSNGYENADKCAWTFGASQLAKNGSKYNMTFGGRNWYIQQNWVNAKGGYCALHL